jgi:hypothetical protein
MEGPKFVAFHISPDQSNPLIGFPVALMLRGFPDFA